MDSMKATVGNGVSWVAVAASFASQVLPIFQLLAVLVAIAASTATFIYFRRKAQQE